MKPFSVRLCPVVSVCPQKFFSFVDFLFLWEAISGHDYIFGLCCLSHFAHSCLPQSSIHHFPFVRH
jgi:hypothetical protein